MKIKKIVSFLVMMTLVFALHSQTFNWVYDEEKEYKTPIGEGTYEQLKNSEFWAEMEEYYQKYELKNNFIEKINALFADKLKDKNLSVDVVFGGWCGDSKEQMPAFMKIKSQIDVLSDLNIRWIGCDRRKNSGNIDIREMYIEYFPTFIFYLDGEEMCRIIETPRTGSIEEDLFDMLDRQK
ncbi:MAG: thioredoxin family protein [Bacteroidales bacterium]|jgi:thiol-disulfide isomerase/thioredoxin|nr:thioredoxin family protein [Bacteroidales bacterium]